MEQQAPYLTEEAENQYRPWVELGLDELQYYKRRFLEVTTENAALEAENARMTTYDSRLAMMPFEEWRMLSVETRARINTYGLKMIELQKEYLEVTTENAELERDLDEARRLFDTVADVAFRMIQEQYLLMQAIYRLQGKNHENK